MTKLDTEPTEDYLSKAIDSLTSDKAPGKDGIPSRVSKHGKPALLHHLHVLLILCWKDFFKFIDFSFVVGVPHCGPSVFKVWANKTEIECLPNIHVSANSKISPDHI